MTTSLESVGSHIQANGMRLHLQTMRATTADGSAAGGRDGKRETIVLIHGLLTDSLASYYFTLGPGLAEAGFDVVMYDLRGHGRSERPYAGYRLDDFTTDLVALLDSLGLDQPVHLVGNSFGGAIGFAVAAAHPTRVASVIAIEAQPPVESWLGQMKVGFEDAVTWLPDDNVINYIAEVASPHTARLCRKAWGVMQRTDIAADIMSSDVLDDSLPGLRCPVLALTGSETGMAKEYLKLSRNLDDWKVVVMPEQGHSVLIERSQETLEYITAWVGGEYAEHASASSAA
ncbi:alpha/beta fold hydrolase [Williamsia sp. CHRR-6]|uniref:alpha/beta fold hydrolase n=1 Tax=Williamsia sp. CHRR-6 TaxID=2835871 RepID=UPI001BD980EC|nr:alpha/beta hydrolase [Williamsia sp. CHRR-6]MBT0566022.1 alpha/beta hydrolase [Williamsia sp. CHRR-6]